MEPSFFDRQQWEEHERRWLAPWAMKSADSRGRQYPDAEPPYRSAFQRDRDRLIHTTAFRRLEYKTQVFVSYEGDYYRTRLTHTIEVSQIARTIARALRANEDLTEAIATAHDIGHTPFGHSGEEVLHELMRDHGGFDHNLQALRLVTELERRYPDFPGLNLTWEVREGIVKHKTEYDRGDYSDGYDPDKMPTIEAQIVNAADEIAYTTHDLDDGLRAGLLEPRQLLDLDLWRDTLNEAGIDPDDDDELARHRAVRRLIDVEVTDLIATTAAALQQNAPANTEAIRSLPGVIVQHSAEMATANRSLKDFLFTRLYRHWRVLRMASKSQRLVRALFRVYIEDPRQLPQSVQLAAADGLHRAVCDYIAGMTDRYAIEEYRKLFDPMLEE
ncbi:MAG: deoxyguanosinetriphosphate triphosphohydrolase [Anaerolineae bacterium]